MGTPLSVRRVGRYPYSMANLDLGKLLSEAVARLNDDEISGAEALLQQVLESGAEVPQAWMLMGVVRLRQNRPADAETLFCQVLKKHPDQPTTLFYLGNARRDQGAVADATASYRNALRVRPDYGDAELALAGALRSLGQLEEAKIVYQRHAAREGASAEAASGLGNVLNELGDYAGAERVLAAALKSPAPAETIADIESGLGTAKMLVRRFAEALPHFERAIALVPGHTTATRSRARVLDYLNRTERAADAYRRVLSRDPLDLKTHLLLNELLHRSGDSANMLHSYDEALRARPASPIPPTAKGDQLLLLARPEEALASYQRARRLAPDHIPAYIGAGRAMAVMGQFDDAIKTFEAAKTKFADHPGLDTAFAYVLLQADDSKKALKLAENARAMSPTDQAALAVLGLCYRAINDARENELFGYERFVQIFDLEPPPGYSDIGSFHDDLSRHLGALHGQTTQFFSQTLRSGTRTVEEIFELHHPLRNGLKQRIGEAVTRYVQAMPEDPRHPFLSRRQAGGFRFSGSWSSRMRCGGHHVNHIHDGWISSVYYVDVPNVASDAASYQGWLKLGEPSADLGFANAIRRLVQPKPGRLVLFPSYLWHGTVPFNSDETRMTIAFDAVPLPRS